MKKTFLIFACYLLLAAPFSVSAQGIVPCGGSKEPCTFCHLLQLLDNLISFVFKIIFPIAAILIVVGGFMIMFSMGEPGKAKKGREIITAAAVGIAIALVSWVILDTIFKIIVSGGDWTAAKLGPWYEISCAKR